MLYRKYVLLLALVFSGCVLARPKYQEWTDQGGYTDRRISKNYYVTRFWAPPEHDRRHAANLTRVRAIEICNEKGGKFAVTLAILDRSRLKEKGPPNKTIPDFRNEKELCRYSDSECQSKNAYVVVDHYFACEKKVGILALNFGEVSSDELRGAVKDGKGGLKILQVFPNGPNRDLFEPNDIILKIDQKRVSDAYGLQNAIAFRKNQQKVKVQFVRNGKIKNVSAKFLDITEGFEEQRKSVADLICKLKADSTLCVENKK